LKDPAVSAEGRRGAMHPFELTLSIVGPVVGGIIVLTVFFKLIGWIDRRSVAGTTRIAFKGVVDRKTLVVVHLATGRTIENVRLIGFTDSGSIKGPFPYELQNLVILEGVDGRRLLVQSRQIRMIEVPPQPASSA
jgi:hypothetical protein